MYYRDELFMCLLACWITLSWGQQFAPLVHISFFINNDTGIILRMDSSNERRRYNVTAFAIDWDQTQMIFVKCVATIKINMHNLFNRFNRLYMIPQNVVLKLNFYANYS